MTTDAPPTRFKPGQRLSADDLNEIVDRIPRLRGGAGTGVSESAAGTSVSRQPGGTHPKRTFFARITGNLPLGSNRWTYAWEEVIKEDPGYGGWSTRPDGRYGLIAGPTTAYNFREEMNSASGVQGHGVNIDPPNFPSGFSTMPCPTGQIVEMVVVRLADGENYEFWFDHINAVDGSCDGESA